MAIELEADLSLSPGEVAAALVQLGLEPQPGSPIAGLPSPADATPLAGLSSARRETVAAALSQLARPGAPPVFRRGRRARPGYRGWLTADAENPDEATLLLLENNGAADVYFGLMRAALTDWLLQPFAGFRVPEIPLPVLDPVPARTMSVVLALADLFRFRYPDPVPDWSPDGDLRFEVAELAALLPPADELHSLRTAWRAVSGPDLPLLDPAELETELMILSLWGWLGKGEALEAIDEEAIVSADEPDSYWLAPAVLWWVRCLAWWNQLLAVDRPSEGLAVIQATALWVIERHDEDGEALLALRTVTPAELHHAVDDALADAWPALAAGGPACPHCGVTVLPTARFCQVCGQPVQPRSCPSCGLEVREGAAFCGHCGQDLP